MKQPSLTWNDEIEAGASLPGLTACGGESVAGERGHLHIALGARALRLQLGEQTPTHWLLPLDNPEVVRLSAKLPGDLLWLSPGRPEAIAGLLVCDFRGAWWEGGFAMVQLRDAIEVYFVPLEFPESGSLSMLAQIVALRWGGCSPERIHKILQATLTNPPTARPAAAHLTAELAVA